MSLTIHTVSSSRAADHSALVAGSASIKDLPIQDRIKAYRDLAKNHGSRKSTSYVLTTASGIPVKIPAGNARLLLDLREAEAAEAVEA
jgi:hypothetical protein